VRGLGKVLRKLADRVDPQPAPQQPRVVYFRPLLGPGHCRHCGRRCGAGGDCRACHIARTTALLHGSQR